MRQLFLYTFLMLLMGCAWELPERKDAQNCTIKPSVKIDKTAGNKLAFTVSLTSITEVETASYTITGPSSPTVSTPSGGSFTSQVTVTVGGNYNIEAKITDKCGKTYSVTGSISTDGCVAPNSDLKISENTSDSFQTTFTLENATDIKTLKWKVNGSSVTSTNTSSVILSYPFVRGTSYKIVAEYTDNCNTNGTTKEYVYNPSACSPPSIVTIVQTNSSPIELTATLSGGNMTDIRGDGVNWKISPVAGTRATNTNTQGVFTGLNANTTYTITAEFSVLGACAVPIQTPSKSITTSAAPVADKTAWSAGGGGDNESGNEIVVDAAGNSYIIGTYDSNTATFSEKTLSRMSAKRDVFIAKYNSVGVCQWVSGLGGSEDDNATGIALDASGNVYIAGFVKSRNISFSSSVSPTYSTTSSNEDIFIAKINGSNGQFMWFRSTGGTDNEKANDIALDGAGNIYITGEMKGTVIFETSRTAGGDVDAFVAKLNTSDGNYTKSTVSGGAAYEAGTCITAKTSSMVIIGGNYVGNTSVSGKTISQIGSFDVFMASYSSANLSNFGVSNLGGTGVDKCTGIITDNNIYFYITGFFTDKIKDPKPTGWDYSSSPRGIFVAKCIDANNPTIQWISGIPAYRNASGVFSEDNAGRINLDTDGNLLVAGSFENSFSYAGNSITSRGSYDGFVAKLNASNGTGLKFYQLGTTGKDACSNAYAAQGKIFTTGFFTGSGTFSGQSISSSAASQDIFITKINP